MIPRSTSSSSSAARKALIRNTFGRSAARRNLRISFRGPTTSIRIGSPKRTSSASLPARRRPTTSSRKWSTGSQRYKRRTMKVIRHAVLALALLVPVAASAAELNCSGPSNVEEFRYAWHLRGGLGWVAGFFFPRSGFGDLKTTYPSAEKQTISSELMVTGGNGTNGFYNYQSEIDENGRTLSTYHGYAWGKKSRKERTIFDYVKRLARIHKETPTVTEDNVRALPSDEQNFRDILTAIHYMRTNADDIKAPMTTTIYSDGKEYPVIFKPAGRQV